MDKKAKLTKYSIYEKDDHLYLSLTYVIEDDHRIIEMKFPEVVLDIGIYDYPHTSYYTRPDGHRKHWIRFEAKNYEVGAMVGTDDIVSIVRTIYEKPTELTLEEIEKKLGYKVKIVSKEN